MKEQTNNEQIFPKETRECKNGRKKERKEEKKPIKQKESKNKRSKERNTDKHKYMKEAKQER